MIIDGREYITPEQYAAKYGRDASGLRYAARHNRAGLGDAALSINASMKAYPLDLVEAWRSGVAASDYGRGAKHASDISRIAARYDLDRQMVWRAVQTGKIRGAVQEASGTWRISDRAAAEWAAEWLGITEPVQAYEDAAALALG